MDKLYRIKSNNEIVSSHEGAVHLGVTIHWFCIDRRLPAVAYDAAIPEWASVLASGKLDDRQLSYYNTASTYIDQHFTQCEAENLLKVLADNHASALVLEEVSLPVYDADVPYCSIPEQPLAGDGYGFVDLPAECSVGLPIKIRGYFDSKYFTTLERYQVLVTRSLMDFESTQVETGQREFDQTVQEQKLNICQLYDSLVGLRSALDLLDACANIKSSESVSRDQSSDSA